jgi:ferric-dicitrate binding protein FerR (iron transport regulator)
MQNNTHIPEEINLMIVCYLTHSIDKNQLLRLREWISESAQNLDYFNQYRASWILSDNKDEELQTESSRLWNRIENEIIPSGEAEPKTLPGRNRSFGFLKYAAILVLMVSLSSTLTWWFMKPGEFTERMVEYVVPKGSKSSIKLPDGSVVWLNAGSKLQYATDFDKKERKVFLSGEAHFTVVSNKNKPFKVHTSDLIVRALGTKFNVKAYPEEKIITTILEEGVIDVQVIKGKKASKNQIKVEPNQKLVYFKDAKGDEHIARREIEETKKITRIDENIRVVSEINTELYTSWKNDKWIIEGLTLKCLAPILERRYNIAISFSKDGVDQYKFSGILHNETVEQIMDVLRYTAPVKYSIVRDSIFISTDHAVKKNFERIITTRSE